MANPKKEQKSAAGRELPKETPEEVTGAVTRESEESAAAATLTEAERGGELVEGMPELQNLEQIDSDVSREQIERVLSTLPKGWLRHVGTMQFLDVDRGEFAAEVDQLSIPSVITFWRRAQRLDPGEVWGGVILHEVGHANDWERGIHLGKEGRQKLKEAVTRRSKDDDRYHSLYAESWEYRSTYKRDIKIKEYWAEIVQAYLNAEDPMSELAEADRMLVESVIRKTDPTFDQRQSRLKREAVVREMARPKYDRLFTSYASKMPQGEIDDLRVRFETMVDAPQEVNRTLQRDGRHLLAERLRQWSTSPEHRKLAWHILQHDRTKAELSRAFQRGLVEECDLALERYTEHSSQITALEDKLVMGGEPDIVREAQDLIEKYQIAFGSRVVLEKGEYHELIDLNIADSSSADWIPIAAGWEAAPEDHPYAEEISARRAKTEIDIEI